MTAVMTKEMKRRVTSRDMIADEGDEMSAVCRAKVKRMNVTDELMLLIEN